MTVSIRAKLPTEFNHSSTYDPMADIVTFGWDLDAIRHARDSHIVGNFRSSAPMLTGMGTDPQFFGAMRNRTAPHRTLERGFTATRNDVATRAKREFSKMKLLPSDAVNQASKELAGFGLSVQRVVTTYRNGGAITDMMPQPWPMSRVWYDSREQSLMTFESRAQPTPTRITHGDGKWIVVASASATPWLDGAIVPLASTWGSRAYTERDRQRSSAMHGMAKIVGVVPIKHNIQDAPAQAFKNLVKGLQGGKAGGLMAEGFEIKWLESNSQMWQIFAETLKGLNANISTALLGQTGATQAEGGNYKKDDNLFKVRADIWQSDLEALSYAYSTGLVRPWAAANYGIIDDAIRIDWLYPDPDEQARQMHYSTQYKAFVESVAKTLSVGGVVSQAWINAEADRHGVVGFTLGDGDSV